MKVFLLTYIKIICAVLLVVPRVEIREHIKGANNLISSLNFNFFSLSLRKMNFSSSVIL